MSSPAAPEPTADEEIVAAARERAAHLYPDGMPEAQLERLNGIYREHQERIAQQDQQAN